jgi:uncharacterized protein (TIGR02466 family)
MMPPAVVALFPTRVYRARFPAKSGAALNERLLKECLQLRRDDSAGRRWSKQCYPGGYTSYQSVHKLHELSPTFAELRQRLKVHVAKFLAALEWDLMGRRIEMTDCWVNINPRGSAHGLHLHPLSTLSGTYYVRTPPGSPGLKFEDPRLDRFMASPPRRHDAVPENRPWVTMPAQEGAFLLFESWLRHEVPANPVRGERVSISFNYHWAQR